MVVAVGDGREVMAMVLCFSILERERMVICFAEEK
jgi:hypothetical protein